MIARAGKLRVQGNVLRWIDAALKTVGAGVAPIEPAVAVDAVELPGNWHHADPVDRIIVATARHLDAALVTADTEILLNVCPRIAPPHPSEHPPARPPRLPAPRAPPGGPRRTS